MNLSSCGGAKTKNWKEDENEQRRIDNRYHNRNSSEREERPTPPVQYHDRFPRDGQQQRQDRNERNDRYDKSNESNFRSARDNRAGGDARSNRGFGNSSSNNSRYESNGSMDRSFSDNGSETSSRGSRRGRRGSSGGRSNGGVASARGRRDSDNSRRSKPSTPPRAFQSRESLVSTGPTQQIKIPPPNITAGAVKFCDIVYVTSPTDFYVQLSPDSLELDAVMAKIATTYGENGGTLMERSRISQGVDCIAQYSEDLQWYRATVKSVESSAATVSFVDYGNVETVKFNQIKEIEAEHAKLPAQGIACKLLAARKTSWEAQELEKFNTVAVTKILEAEFVARDNDAYEVLLREVIDGTPVAKFINEEFSQGADLMEAKKIARSKGRSPPKILAHIAHDSYYAPLDQQWTDVNFAPGSKEKVTVTWFTNPENFYASVQKDDFKTMMNDIQQAYARRKQIAEPLKVIVSAFIF